MNRARRALGLALGAGIAHTIRGSVIVGWTYAVPLLTVAGLFVWTVGPSCRPVTRAGAERS